MADYLGTDASMLAAQISSNTEMVYGSWDSEPPEPDSAFSPEYDESPAPGDIA
jgi:TatD DNase family protein